MSYGDEKGFTLVEVLVSMAIVAVMLAIAVPEIQELRNTAKRAILKAEVAELGKTLFLDLSKNEGIDSIGSFRCRDTCKAALEAPSAEVVIATSDRNRTTEETVEHVRRFPSNLIMSKLSEEGNRVILSANSRITVREGSSRRTYAAPDIFLQVTNCDIGANYLVRYSEQPWKSSSEIVGSLNVRENYFTRCL